MTSPTSHAPLTKANPDRWLHAVLDETGAAVIHIGDTTIELSAPDLDTGRKNMITELRRAAAGLPSRRVRVEITDPSGVWPIEVPAEGPPQALPSGPDVPPPAHRPLRPVPAPAAAPAPAPVPAPAEAPAPAPVPAPVAAPAPPVDPPTDRTPVVPAAPGPDTNPGQPVPPEVPNLTRPSFDDLLASRPDPHNAPASEGWRGAARQITGGRLRLAPGRIERAHRDRIRRIQKPLGGPKTIVVVNPKGGAHKTTSALQLAQKFGTLRGGGVAFYDDNESRASAAWRAMPGSHSRTVDELLQRLRDYRSNPIQGIADLDDYVRSQGPANFDLLAAAEPDDPLKPKHIPASDVDSVHATLSRFYRVIIIDTGNTMHAPNWGAAVLRADQLVIVSNIREDTALSAGWLAQALQRAGREELLSTAVTVLSAPVATQRDLHKQFREHFAKLTRAVFTVPFDPALDDGRPIDYNALSDATHEAWLEVAAAVADGL